MFYVSLQLSAQGRRDRWIWKCGGSRPGEAMRDHKTGQPVRACSEVDISIHPACSAALHVYCGAVRQVRVWMRSLGDSCEGHHQWIMQSQKHLKGHVVRREEGKGQLPSVFERHPARSWVGTLSITSLELECHKVAQSFSPVSQTYRG